MRKPTRIFAFIAALCLCAALAACGSSAGSDTPKDYAQIITKARDAEYNEAYNILTNGDSGYELTGGNADSMSAEDTKNYGDMLISIMGLETGDMSRYAISASLMNVKSYCVAIVLPAEGKSDTVKTALQNYIQAQQNAQQFYLPDQYEIALDARLEQGADGSWVLVMSENASSISTELLNALK